MARDESVALIDLNRMGIAFYETLGVKDSDLAFADGGRDRTHHSNHGAYELARRIAMGIRTTDQCLADHLAADTQTTQRFSDDSL